jgi:hypothetical protein
MPANWSWLPTLRSLAAIAARVTPFGRFERKLLVGDVVPARRDRRRCRRERQVHDQLGRQ